MKFKINATEYAAITDDATRALYKKSGDDYVAVLDGMPDFDGLSRKNAELLNEIKTGKQTREEQERAAQAERDELARKAGNVEALETSYKKQIADLQAGWETERGQLQGSLNKTLITNVAQKLAGDLFGDNASLMMPHILPRLSVELVGDQHITRVLDADGKPTALDIPGLAKEFGANKAYAAVLKGPGSQGTPKPGDPSTPKPTQTQNADPNFNTALAAIKAMDNSGVPNV